MALELHLSYFTSHLRNRGIHLSNLVLYLLILTMLSFNLVLYFLFHICSLGLYGLLGLSLHPLLNISHLSLDM